MPAEPLFDYSRIDLSQVAVSPERVGELNPQSGDMRHLDYVIWISDDQKRALGVKEVGEDEFWVPGHVPGRPLFPGVLMIEAGAQLGSIIYRLRTDESRLIAFTRCDNAVFRSQVEPGDRLLLLVEELSRTRRRFACQAQGIVENRIAFEAKITGVVV